MDFVFMRYGLVWYGTVTNNRKLHGGIFRQFLFTAEEKGEVASWTSSGARTKPARRQPAVFGPQQGLGNVFLPERQEPPPFHRKRRERSRKRRGLGPIPGRLGPRQAQQRRHPRICGTALERRPVVQLEVRPPQVLQSFLRVGRLPAQRKPSDHGPRVDVDF